MNFWKCFRYLVFIGVVAFPVGRLLPKKWFCTDMFPYRSDRFEDEGRYYDKFKIRYWQSKVPDMSKILPKCIPAKIYRAISESGCHECCRKPVLQS